MSEYTSDTRDPTAPIGTAATPKASELPELDFAGLTLAIEMVSRSAADPEALATLLRNELVRLREQAGALVRRFAQSTLELRRLLENTPETVAHQHDELRRSQEQNDRFVVRLVDEHETELAELRRERDTAIARVRELSRELARAGVSTPKEPSDNSPITRRPTEPADQAAQRLRELLALTGASDYEELVRWCTPLRSAPRQT